MYIFRLALRSLCLLLIVFIPAHSLGAGDAGNAGSDILIVAGVITDEQKKPVKDAELWFFFNGQKIVLKEEISSWKGGGYEAELILPKGTLPGAKVEIEARKPSYKSSERIPFTHILRRLPTRSARTL